jgi:hypothetical protein
LAQEVKIRGNLMADAKAEAANLRAGCVFPKRKQQMDAIENTYAFGLLAWNNRNPARHRKAA